MARKILIVDDAEDIRVLIQEVLQAAGYEVLAAPNGTEALRTIETESLDLVILDIVMPGMSGFHILRQIRETSDMPVIMLSSRTDSVDKLESFELGADDYITKPFELAELTARVGAVLRRGGTRTCAYIEADFYDGRLLIDFTKRRITVEGKEVELTPKEYSLLRELVLNAGIVLEYRRLLTIIWGSEYGDEKKLVNAVVRRLRLIIEADYKDPQYIQAVHGVGYRFRNTL